MVLLQALPLVVLMSGIVPDTKNKSLIVEAFGGQTVSFEFPVTVTATNIRIYLRRPKATELLVASYDREGHRGRYSIKYYAGVLSVTIRDVVKADSGGYKCGVRKSTTQKVLAERRVELRIRERQSVTEAPLGTFSTTEDDDGSGYTETPTPTDDGVTFSSFIIEDETTTVLYVPEDTTFSTLAFSLVVIVSVILCAFLLVGMFFSFVFCWRQRLNVVEVIGNAPMANIEIVTYENVSTGSRRGSTDTLRQNHFRGHRMHDISYF